MLKKTDAALTQSLQRAEAKAPLNKSKEPATPNAAYLLQAKEDVHLLRNLPFGAR